MKDRDIDDILRRSAGVPHQVESDLLDRVTSSIRSSLRPVRPLPPAWVLVSGLFLICEAVALTGAAKLGMFGLRKLNAPEIGLIFPALVLFALLAAMLSVGEMTPGSRRRIAPAALPAIGSLSLLAIFALLFDDYRLDRFAELGLPCLTTGLLHALPAGLASWLLLRHGFAVNPVAAGMATAILASLAGVTMLELHCANLQAIHVMVWHTAVIPVSALAGALLVRAATVWVSGVRRRR
jgi:hypothetical protein